MNRKLVQIISIILVVVIVFSVPTFAELSDTVVNDAITETTEFIAEVINLEDETTTEPTEPAEPTEPTEPTEQTEPTEPSEPIEEPQTDSVKKFEDYNDDEKVAVMYICAQQRGMGHAWIYVESLVDCDIPVGCYTLKPDCGVSIGTFSVSHKNGPGVYYNVESYRNIHGKPFRNPCWLKVELSKAKLLKVNKSIRTANYWDIYFNCTFFAARIWNVASKKKVIPLMFPIFITWQLAILGATKDVQLKPAEKEDCYKQRGSGEKAHIVHVKDNTFD